MVRSVEELEVFRLAHHLTLRVYQLSARFLVSERFGLMVQLRRAAASVCANLAEGAGRLTRGEYRQFVGVAKGSAAEAAYHLLLAHDLGYVTEDEYKDLRREYDQIGRMLTRLSQSLSRRG